MAPLLKGATDARSPADARAAHAGQSGHGQIGGFLAFRAVVDAGELHDGVVQFLAAHRAGTAAKRATDETGNAAAAKRTKDRTCRWQRGAGEKTGGLADTAARFAHRTIVVDVQFAAGFLDLAGIRAFKRFLALLIIDGHVVEGLRGEIDALILGLDARVAFRIGELRAFRHAFEVRA